MIVSRVTIAMGASSDGLVTKAKLVLLWCSCCLILRACLGDSRMPSSVTEPGDDRWSE